MDVVGGGLNLIRERSPSRLQPPVERTFTGERYPQRRQAPARLRKWRLQSLTKHCQQCRLIRYTLQWHTDM